MIIVLKSAKKKNWKTIGIFSFQYDAGTENKPKKYGSRNGNFQISGTGTLI